MYASSFTRPASYGLSGLGSTMADWAGWVPGDPVPTGPVSDIQTQASVGGTTVAFDSPGKTSEQLRAEMEAPGYEGPTVPGLNDPSTPGYVWDESGHAVPGYSVDFDLTQAAPGVTAPPQVDAQGESASDAPYTPPAVNVGGNEQGPGSPGGATGGGYPGGGSSYAPGGELELDEEPAGNGTLLAGLGLLGLFLIARPRRR